MGAFSAFALLQVFEELLLDADWSVNAGSWMWLSCSAFFQQFFHCYCPVGFGKRTDPTGDYIRYIFHCNPLGVGYLIIWYIELQNEFPLFLMPARRYIPILKDYPNRYIYEPWNAPESVQKAANCVVGVDYPKPMINHAEGSRLNIERMKQVYQQLSHYRGLSKSAVTTKCSVSSCCYLPLLVLKRPISFRQRIPILEQLLYITISSWPHTLPVKSLDISKCVAAIL